MMEICIPKTSWLTPKVQVARSTIHGLGLFAVEHIARGEAISRLGGMLATDAALQRLIRDTHSPYVDSVALYNDTNLVLEPGTISRNGNHSCEPTAWWQDPLTISAPCDLTSGVEITIDYATLTADDTFSMICSCGTPLCRKEVTGVDWQLKSLQNRYQTHWVPVLLQRILRSSKSIETDEA